MHSNVIKAIVSVHFLYVPVFMDSTDADIDVSASMQVQQLWNGSEQQAHTAMLTCGNYSASQIGYAACCRY